MEGKTINGYTLQRQLGVGGMAEVWLADNAIGKKAAVKLLLPKFCNDEAIVARFENEAKVMVQLDHPNIRQVYDYANIDGRPCIVMEYLEGDDLKALMKSGKRFTEEELCKWWNQIADALNYTHAKGIVHRDIKPSNLFLDKKGNIKLLDFGIAKIKESISMTQTGAMMGTLLYMSPEQVEDSKHIGPQSDIYSLAVTFVHLLTGKAPYDITTSSDYAIRKGIVEIPLDLTAVPADWRGFLAPYLAKKPENRPTLKPFEAVAYTPPTSTSDDDDATISDNAVAGATAPPFKGTGGIKTTHPTSTDNPKSKKAFWIALGAVAAVAVLLVLLLKSKKEDPLATDPDTQAYGVCQTVADYRAYMNGFGLNALHYGEAKQFVDNYIADSTAQAQQDLVEAQAQQQAEAEAQAQADAEKKEDAAYKKCTTVEACNAYLKAYPKGRYVDEVKARKEEVEAKAAQASLTGTTNGHEWVDLGLPSGTLWATCNVGAKNPEDYGNYYAWGETSTKSTYDVSTYKYANGGDYNKLTKYCSNSDYGNNGFADNLTTLQAGDDPATANWGSGWRMPSHSQWDELRENTTSTWTTRNGVKGRLFTARNGQSLFLPAAGCLFWGSNIGSDGYYWSRSLWADDPGYAWYLCFGSVNCFTNCDYRGLGFSVRPVHEK